jgi:hypothetical protein
MGKAVNWYFGIYLVAYSVIMLSLFGCHSSKRLQQTVSDSVRVEYKVKDTTIYLPGDTVSISSAVPCPDAVWSGEAMGTRVSLKATLQNGNLKVSCKTDSLVHRITYLEKELAHKSTVRVPVAVPVIQHRPPWWAKLTLIISLVSIGYIIVKNRLKVLSFATKIIKLFA